jgi:hypothetical protein
MTPGPVSDSYDPEFGTGENADLVRTAITGVAKKLARGLPSDLRNIVELANEGPKARSKTRVFRLTESEQRVVRFALQRALESV